MTKAPWDRGFLTSARRASNPRPSAWEADALPTELLAPGAPRVAKLRGRSTLLAMRWVAIGVAALLVGLLAYGVASQGTDSSIDEALAEGERAAAPSGTLPRLGADGTGSLDAYKGKVV